MRHDYAIAVDTLIRFQLEKQIELVQVNFYLVKQILLRLVQFLLA
ncbi:hypothetical protein [uncultured Nostoc sp.]